MWANYQQGAVVEGASTITMQLVRNLLLTRERQFDRKIAEAVLAMRIENDFSKEEIFEMYLNNIYWGHNNYGIETAAQSYFNKSAAELNLAESAVLAGMIQAPEAYSPFINYSQTKARQATVLDRMAKLRWIPPEEAEAAKVEPLLVGKPTAWKPSKTPYITNAVVTELENRFGEDAVLEGGMRVQTTVDYEFQQMAKDVVRKAHQDLQRRGLKDAQVALVAVDPRTHFVKAMVGGVDYSKSELNRAIQSYRQPGSAFKPFVYYTAFASGKYTPFTTVADTPVSYPDGSGKLYSPRNYGGGFRGIMTIKEALMFSRNVPAIKVGQDIGVENVVETARTLGVTSPLKPVISLPLGAIGITPLELANAYATFASNGRYARPTTIVRVTDSAGNLLMENIPEPEQVLDPWATASLTTVLKGVVEGGTGTAAQLNRPTAGKTGTTDSERDVWFIGFVPQLATAVWIGNDDNTPLGRGVTGGGFAAPIWKEFMTKALTGEPIQYFPAASQFTRPPAPKEEKKQ
jgi:1A family penicillin-binding protein